MLALRAVQRVYVTIVRGKHEKGGFPMPEFKIKNLMVDIVSGVKVPDLDKLCLYPTKLCLISKCFKYISCETPSLCITATCTVPSAGCLLPCSKYLTKPPCPMDTCHHPTYVTPDVLIACGDSKMLVIDLDKLAINPEVIKEVQAELDQVLKVVAEHGVEINQAMAPQTLAQAEVLEKELTAALEEVKRLKGGLK
jgi:hypothetical protein